MRERRLERRLVALALRRDDDEALRIAPGLASAKPSTSTSASGAVGEVGHRRSERDVEAERPRLLGKRQGDRA